MRLHRIDESNKAIWKVEEFARWILQVGEGQVQGISISDKGEWNWIKIAKDFLIRNDKDGLYNLITSIYPNFDTKYKDWSYLHERGILTPPNDNVDEINTIMLCIVPRDVKSYMSYDIPLDSNNCCPSSDMEPPELLHPLKIWGFSNHCPDLKVGAPIILLRTLN